MLGVSGCGWYRGVHALKVGAREDSLLKHLVFPAVLACLTAASNAETITVCPDGACDHVDVQDAIDSASNGDFILVGPGTYGPIDLLGKSLFISGDGDRESVILDGGGASRVVHASQVSTGAVSMSNLTIRNGYIFSNGSSVGAGIECSGTDLNLDNIVLESCRLERNSTGYHDTRGAGIHGAPTNLVLTNSVVRNNTIELVNTGSLYSRAGGYGGGISVLGGSLEIRSTRIEENSVQTSTTGGSWHDNHAMGGGVLVQDAAMVITDSVVANNLCSVVNPSSSVATCLPRGGGLMATGNGEKYLANVQIIGNRIVGRSSTTYDSQNYNSTIGGGMIIGGPVVSVLECRVESNVVEGGLDRPGRNAGGGIWFEGYSGKKGSGVLLIENTIVRENLSGGEGSLGERIASGIGFAGVFASITVRNTSLSSGEQLAYSMMHNWNVDSSLFAMEDVFICGSTNPIGGSLTEEGVNLESACADCNGDGLADIDQIISGELEDLNDNRTPDCCELGGDCGPCPDSPWDLNQDGMVDGGDVGLFLGLWGECVSAGCPGDFNLDGEVSGADLGLILGYWGVCQ